MIPIQLVDLPTIENFIVKRDPSPPKGTVIIYETSWISATQNCVVCYVGSHKVGNTPYYGSGFILQKHIQKSGVKSLRFRILKSLTIEELNSRFEIETAVISEYRAYFTDRCKNIGTRAGGGGVVWTLEMKEKFKQTSLERFGVDHPRKADSVKAKIRETHKKNLGVDYPMQSAEIREKSKQSCLEKYGVENISQSEDIKAIKDVTREKNGTTYKDAYEVHKATLQARYGEDVINTSQIPGVQQKKRENVISRYLDFDHQPKQAKAVEQLNLKTGRVLAIYPSGAAAANVVNPDNPNYAKSQICNVCKNRVQQYKGYKWRYVNKD